MVGQSKDNSGYFLHKLLVLTSEGPAIGINPLKTQDIVFDCFRTTPKTPASLELKLHGADGCRLIEKIWI